jgi:hypothetical protein
MGKPFKIVEQGPQPVALVGRNELGKFHRIEAQTPEELKAEARSRGVMVQAVATQRQAPDTEVSSENKSTESGEAASYDPVLPWPPAGPINDDNHVPFKNLK